VTAWFVAVFVITTETPGRPALVASTTSPEMVPRSDCAAAAAGSDRTTAASRPTIPRVMAMDSPQARVAS
jgi:hypothetical protein